ncbi:hypothetical protein MTR67_031668 [Solanum verrucosum]|uniref:Uncharacterized protein n=1 Tax=Solanum verrucosum TaxID=315347 RepID=A0AAF0ZGL2_SOLVR|nr:hypothetical protein MTR67_031668 [Solanum verrucosum]
MESRSVLQVRGS